MEAIDLAKQMVDNARRDPVWFFEDLLNIKTKETDHLNWDLDIWQKEPE